MKKEVMTSAEVLEADSVLENTFSLRALEEAGKKDPVLQEKLDTLTAVSELYKKGLILIQDAQRNGIDTQGLLTRQQETHDQLIETLGEVRDRARICGCDALSDLPGAISRPYAAKIALFIMNEIEKKEKSNL